MNFHLLFNIYFGVATFAYAAFLIICFLVPKEKNFKLSLNFSLEFIIGLTLYIYSIYQL